VREEKQGPSLVGSQEGVHSEDLSGEYIRIT